MAVFVFAASSVFAQERSWPRTLAGVGLAAAGVYTLTARPPAVSPGLIKPGDLACEWRNGAPWQPHEDRRLVNVTPMLVSSGCVTAYSYRSMPDNVIRFPEDRYARLSSVQPPPVQPPVSKAQRLAGAALIGAGVVLATVWSSAPVDVRASRDGVSVSRSVGW